MSRWRSPLTPAAIPGRTAQLATVGAFLLCRRALPSARSMRRPALGCHLPAVPCASPAGTARSAGARWMGAALLARATFSRSGTLIYKTRWRWSASSLLGLLGRAVGSGEAAGGPADPTCRVLSPTR